jgi:flavin-binding protein dodecin
LPHRTPAPRPIVESVMSEHVFKVVDLVGSSTSSIEDAVKNAIERASKTLRNLRWFEIVETRGHIEGGKVAHYQVTIKVGFTMEDAA